MVKIKISKEAAEFIEKGSRYSVNWEDDLIVQHAEAWNKGFEGVKDEAMCMKELSPLQLADILINGYEVR